MKTIIFFLFAVSMTTGLIAQQSIVTELPPDTCRINVPDVITMDSRYGNDIIFRVESNCDVINYHVVLYNRWGVMLFESENILELWDASKIEAGVYVWMVTGEFPDGSAISKKGNVTVKH